MGNPYRDLPDHAFWKRSVAGVPEDEIDPVVAAPFKIGPQDKVATAGSCFAQHISKFLADRGYNYLVTETPPAGEADTDNFGVFPARFGNIYTVRQLLQTFNRAYGLFAPFDTAWARHDQTLVDPFRPQIRSAGFASMADLETDRRRHLGCVRAMFEDCDVFIFTLGLTEAWLSTRDGAVFPLAPGVAGGEMGEGYAFHNFGVDEMVADLRQFIAKLRVVNPAVRLILTVSPVPLIATYEAAHVLTATTYSKAALRVVAEVAARSEPDVCYFPSYEIITGPQARGRYFAPDLRSVTGEGVARVMGLFARHFLDGSSAIARPSTAGVASLSDEDRQRLEELASIVCDEEIIDA